MFVSSKVFLWRIFGKNYSTWDERKGIPVKITRVLLALNYVSGRKWFLKANIED